MKTATLPPLRIDPKLKRGIEAVLEDGESLSSFMLAAITHRAQTRREQRAFLRKAEARSRRAERSGRYVPATEVFERLESILAQAKRRSTRR
jgi:hypothetical protein